MGLAEQQRLLARLYTDAAFRERFLADPRGQGETLGLAPTDVEQLSGLSPQQLGFFARSLYRKRLGEVRKLLPATRRALGPRFAALFQQFCDGYTPGGTKKHRDDALAFAAFLRREWSVPPWIVDLARYEAAWLRATAGECVVLACWFRYPVGAMVREVAEGNGLQPPDKRPTLAFWFRLLGRGRLRHGAWTVFSRPRAGPTARPQWDRGEG